MNSYMSYEIKAAAFRFMTGEMAPGKNAAPGSYPKPFEERYEMWSTWLEENHEMICAMLSAVDSVTRGNGGE